MADKKPKSTVTAADRAASINYSPAKPSFFSPIKPVVPTLLKAPVVTKPLLPTFPKAATQSGIASLGFGNTKVVGGPLASGYVPLKTVSTGKFQGPMIDPNTGKSLIKTKKNDPVPVPKVKPKPVIKPPVPPVVPPVPPVIVKEEEEVVVDTEDKQITDPVLLTGNTDLFPTPFVAYDVPQNDGSIVVAKPATPDLLVVSEEQFSQAYMEKILFENLTGVEIINIARHDMVDGANVEYSDISNLGKISTLYGGANLVALQNTSEQLFRKYPIKLESYVPVFTSDPSGLNRPVYMNAAGAIVVETANAILNEEVDIHIISSIDDTIY